MVGSAVWSQPCECVPIVFSTSSNDGFCVAMHGSWKYRKLLNCVGMNWLVICIDVEQQRGKNAALWKVNFPSANSTAFADEVHTKTSV